MGSRSWKPTDDLSRSRREFLAVTASAAFSARVMADLPNADNPYLRLIPADKGLDPTWVQSLFERGEKQTYESDAAKQHIGMPVGGLLAGTVYLGGDGKLWLWNIFNDDPRGISPRPFVYEGKRHQANEGLNYVFPAKPTSPFRQSFSIKALGKEITLDKNGFQSVSFRGEYPRAIVSFRDTEIPVSATLEAFSPFIPMNVDDSSLPATVMSYTIKNDGDEPLDLQVIGSMQNAICLLAESRETLRLHNRVVNDPEFIGVECSAEGMDFRDRVDFGTMTLALFGNDQAETTWNTDFDCKVSRSVRLEPDEETVVTFLITWHFPNYRNKAMGNELVGHYYATRFDSSTEVTRYLATNAERLFSQTRAWVDAWYDSSLPYWFLDRTMANTSALATTTCYRFKNGRFWAYESPGHLPGTCAHVWHYAQSLARLFPELERETRDKIDFGLGQNPDGSISFRTNQGPMSTKIIDGRPAIADDGHLGRILCVYREHQMTTDLTFLKAIWPRVKRAMDWAIAKDGNDDGVIEGAQRHTLVKTWYGKVSWLASLYLAALRASEAMASEVGDTLYAERCKRIADSGSREICNLYDGEYFIQEKGPGHEDTTGAGLGCYIDQTIGQTWAHWVGLGTIYDRDRQVRALRSLYRYNFVTDYGPFRETFKRGRYYALAGDAGLLMCTWPKSEPDALLYFYELMTGFEWQAASHMIFEGIDHPDLLQNGLAVARSIHDRYDAEKRNPYSEIEDGDHYVRAMASYGAYQAACGYEHHGPKGILAFTPRLSPNDFKAAFTAANSWGTYSQRLVAGQMQAKLEIKFGVLELQQIKLRLGLNKRIESLVVMCNDEPINASFRQDGPSLYVKLNGRESVRDGETLTITITVSEVVKMFENLNTRNS